MLIVAARPCNCTWHTENMIVLNAAYGLWRKKIGGEQFFKFFEISYLYEARTVFQFFGWWVLLFLCLSVSAHSVLSDPLHPRDFAGDSRDLPGGF
jgi:hypothetical protein